MRLARLQCRVDLTARTISVPFKLRCAVVGGGAAVVVHERVKRAALKLRKEEGLADVSAQELDDVPVVQRRKDDNFVRHGILGIHRGRALTGQELLDGDAAVAPMRHVRHTKAADAEKCRALLVD